MSTLTVRPTVEADLPFVLATEDHARRGGFVGGWTEAEHRAAMTDPAVVHWTLEAGERVGYLILRGVGGEDRNIELKRITLAVTDRGYGRQALRLVKRHTFGALGAHRLWLDVFEHNHRARHLYESEGFVVEGVMRECFRTADGWASLILLSMLEHEYVPSG